MNLERDRHLPFRSCMDYVWRMRAHIRHRRLPDPVVVKVLKAGGLHVVVVLLIIAAALFIAINGIVLTDGQPWYDDGSQPWHNLVPGPAAVP